MGRNSLYYIDIVKNNLPSEKTKIEPTNKNNLLEQINNKINLLEQINNKINSLEQTSKIKLWH
jgi:hypothetical protein